MNKSVLFAVILLFSSVVSAGIKPGIAKEPAPDLGTLDKIIAIVNSEAVLASELKDYDFTLKNFRHQSLSEITPEQKLNEIIIDKIQLQLAKKASIKVNDVELNQAYQRLARQNNITTQQFDEKVMEQGIKISNFKSLLRKELTIKKFQVQQISRRINVSDDEVNRYLELFREQLENASYQIKYLSIPPKAWKSELYPSKQALVKVARATADSEAYLAKFNSQLGLTEDSEKLAWKTLDWRKKQELPTLFEKAATKLNVSEISEPIYNNEKLYLVQLVGKKIPHEKKVEELQLKHILVKPNIVKTKDDVRHELTNVREKILSKKHSFEEMANIHSEDIVTASKGGELGWVAKESLSQDFQTVLKDLKLNQISAPFSSPEGWHILYYVNKRNRDVTEQNLRQKAQLALRNKKFLDTLQDWLVELKDQAYIEVRI